MPGFGKAAPTRGKTLTTRRAFPMFALAPLHNDQDGTIVLGCKPSEALEALPLAHVEVTRGVKAEKWLAIVGPDASMTVSVLGVRRRWVSKKDGDRADDERGKPTWAPWDGYQDFVRTLPRGHSAKGHVQVLVAVHTGDRPVPVILTGKGNSGQSLDALLDEVSKTVADAKKRTGADWPAYSFALRVGPGESVRESKVIGSQRKEFTWLPFRYDVENNAEHAFVGEAEDKVLSALYDEVDVATWEHAWDQVTAQASAPAAGNARRPLSDLPEVDDDEGYDSEDPAGK